jgi:hypothetical protein
MKNLPILMSGPMVVGIQDNLKDMTRRTRGLKEVNEDPDEWRLIDLSPVNGILKALFHKSNGDYKIVKCPYGMEDDSLWVKETWAETCDEHGAPVIAYRADNKAYYIGTEVILAECKASWSIDSYPAFGKWKSSLFLSRRYSRIDNLIRTDTKVERLLDITSEDAVREGFRNRQEFLDYFYGLNPKMNTKNPFNWAIGFRRVK